MKTTFNVGDIVSVKIGDDPNEDTTICEIVEQWPILYGKASDGTKVQLFRGFDEIKHLSNEKAMLWKLENA